MQFKFPLSQSKPLQFVTAMSKSLPLFLLSSSSAYRLANFRTSPYDKSTKNCYAIQVSFISVEAPPVCYGDEQVACAFPLSSSSAQRLVNFAHLPTISQHRFTSFIVGYPLSQSMRSSLYVAKRAHTLFYIASPPLIFNC